MTRLAWLSLALALAGCPPKRGGGGPIDATGVGCPPASGVYVASYLTPEDGAKGGHTGWVLPLADKIVSSLEGTPDYAPLDGAAAAAAGVPAPPATVWLMAPNARPCKPAIGGYYAAAIDAPTPNLAYGVELNGCAAPQDPQNASAIVLVSDAEPNDCKIVTPHRVAERLGETDKQSHWQRPTKETPVPPALASLIPQKTCTPPTCEKLYSIAQVDLGDGKPVAYAVAVNWLAIPPGSPPEAQCEWKAETFSGFFVAGESGAPTKISEAQEHPLALTAVLADRTGAHVLLAEG